MLFNTLTTIETFVSNIGQSKISYIYLQCHKTPWRSAYPANTKNLFDIYTMLYQRRCRWADIV